MALRGTLGQFGPYREEERKPQLVCSASGVFREGHGGHAPLPLYLTDKVPPRRYTRHIIDIAEIGCKLRHQNVVQLIYAGPRMIGAAPRDLSPTPLTWRFLYTARVQCSIPASM